MNFSLILTFVLIASAISGLAEEFRFTREEGGMGLSNAIIDSKGVHTYIRFDDNSDAKALTVWAALIDAEIDGTSKSCEYNGMFFDQPIIFTGEFTSEVLHTEALHTEALRNIVPSQPYRIFKVNSVKIGFPFSRLKYPLGLTPDSEGSVLETHFGFMTLFPKGIKYDGKKLDLSEYKREPEKGEQGGADQPATAPESKSKGKDNPQPESKVAPR
jgi:hypothetical protein